MESTHKNGFGSQTPHDESIKCNSVEDVLSNAMILRQIFTFLDEKDLESCCHVYQGWRTVAGPLVVTHLDIKLAKTLYWEGRIVGSDVSAQLANSRHYITVGVGARYNRKSFTRRTNLGVAQILELILTQKVSISLSLSRDVDIHDDKVVDFLSKIGPVVLDLDIHCKCTRRGVFYKLLLQKFPNLKKLNCLDFCPIDDTLDDQLFDTDLPRNKHKGLRKIVLGYPQFNFSFVKTMLKMCANLETIEDFPLKYINAIVLARKGPALKSLLSSGCIDSDFGQTRETVVTAYDKLARLKPKLTSLAFASAKFNSEENFKLVQPHLFCLLKSSQESLEVLQIAPLRSDAAEQLPTLKGLKELELLRNRQGDAVFFTRKFQVKEIFPNVRKFGSTDHTWDEAFFKRHLPENVICPWGTQIIELSVNRLALSALPLLHRRFPSIQKLELKTSLVDLSKILLELSRFWPQLKSLTISWDDSDLQQMKRMGWIARDYRIRLDHCFTGLPFKFIDQLEYPSSNRTFTDEAIQVFKDRSIIAKLKELRELKIFLSESVEYHDSKYRTGHAYMRLSPVANEFGFKLLPELAVTLAVEGLVCFAKKMKTALEPLASCRNIEIVNAKDGYPYVF